MFQTDMYFRPQLLTGFYICTTIISAWMLHYSLDIREGETQDPFGEEGILQSILDWNGSR